MPTVCFADRSIACPVGTNLRRLLLDHGLSPHNGRAQLFNCRGLGSCGTCAVGVEGAVSRPTAIERRRLAVPPHRQAAGLRLACQCRVEGDLVLTKYPGFWGQHAGGRHETGAG